MSKELPDSSSRELRRFERQRGLGEIKSIVTPESVENTGLIADRIQGVLEDAYGLKSQKLKKKLRNFCGQK